MLVPPVFCYTVGFVQTLAYASNGQAELRQTLSSAQRYLLVGTVERFHFGGMLDCAKAIEPESISDLVMAYDACRGSPRGQIRFLER